MSIGVGPIGIWDGATLPAFDTPLGRIAALICWENYMPLLRTAMHAKGVQILVRTHGRRARHVACHDAARRAGWAMLCAVAEPVHAATRFPDDLPNDLADGLDDVIATGRSCIVSPLRRR